MSRYLVDTDVLVDFLRGRSQAVDWIAQCARPPMISTVTVAELHAGMRPDEAFALDTMLAVLVSVPVDDAVARLAGKIRREFGPSHGTGMADAMIAASAMESDAVLVTLNRKHFPMVDKLQVPYARY